MPDIENFQEFLQQAEDTFACFEILYGGTRTEEEIIEARIRRFMTFES